MNLGSNVAVKNSCNKQTRTLKRKFSLGGSVGFNTTLPKRTQRAAGKRAVRAQSV